MNMKFIEIENPFTEFVLALKKKDFEEVKKIVKIMNDNLKISIKYIKQIEKIYEKRDDKMRIDFDEWLRRNDLK